MPLNQIPKHNYILLVFFSVLACLDLHFIIVFYLIAYQSSLVNLKCVYDSCGVFLIFNKRRLFYELKELVQGIERQFNFFLCAYSVAF